MKEMLELLYSKFYTPLPMTEAKHEIEECHQLLIDRLDKSEWKLVLRAIDNKDLIAEERSVGSFIRGFRLAWKLVNELDHYEQSRHLLSAE